MPSRFAIAATYLMNMMTLLGRFVLMFKLIRRSTYTAQKKSQIMPINFLANIWTSTVIIIVETVAPATAEDVAD